MLYLIGIKNFNDDTRLLKIGYSDNWERRKSQYLLHNPFTEFLGIKEGDEILEKLFHLRFKELSFSDYGNEWFYYNVEIIKGFNDYTELELFDWLWNNRLEVLDKNYFNKSRTIQCQIVEKLYSGREKDIDWRNKYDNLWDHQRCRKKSEERAWEVSQIDYQDDITVRRILESDYEVEELKNQVNEIEIIYSNFVDVYNSYTEFRDKMRIYCDFLDQYEAVLKTTDLPDVPREFQNYVNLLGTKRVKALGYQKSDLENEYKIIVSQDIAKETILSSFQPNQKLLLRDIKEKLQSIYNSLEIKKTAKASDLGDYFELKDIRIKMEDGRQSKGYELLKIKY